MNHQKTLATTCLSAIASVLALAAPAQSYLTNLYSNPTPPIIDSMTDPTTTLGLQFRVNSLPVGATALYVTRLGVYDSGGDGISGPLSVSLWNNGEPLPLATMTFNSGEGVLEDGFRYKVLEPPAELHPGFEGLIAAWGFTPSDPGYDSGRQDVGFAACQFNGEPYVSAVGVSPFCSGAPGCFPNTFNWIPVRYAAGTLTIAAHFGIPSLHIKLQGHVALVWWPTNATGFVLETSARLGTNQSWSTFASPILVVGDQNLIVAAATGPSRFFRLQKP